VATATELRNEARDLLGRAMKALEDKDNESYRAIWGEYQTKDKEADEAEHQEQVVKAALEKYDPASEVRNPTDALVKGQDPSEAKSGVYLHKEGATGDSSGNFEVIPFASEKSEGWIKGYPASVQHPAIIRRLTPELKVAAQQENDSFIKYIRYGLRALKGDELKALNRLREKALQEDTDSEGGFLVPTDQRTAIILARGVPAGVTRPISTVLTTTRDAGTMPASTDDVTWAAVAEEAAASESNPTFSEVPFTIKKFMRINKVSSELLEDSAVDIGALLTGMFTRSLGRYEDQQAIEGDNSTEPLGLRTTGAAQGNVGDITDLLTLAGPTVVEILAAFYELPAQWRANATWHTTSSFMGLIASIGSTAAGIHVFQELLSAEPSPRLLGRPIVFFDGTGWDNGAAVGANEEVGAIGDFSMYYFVDRVGMSIRRLDELFMANDQVGFAARVRYDSLFAENDAFRIIKGAAS